MPVGGASLSAGGRRGLMRTMGSFNPGPRGTAGLIGPTGPVGPGPMGPTGPGPVGPGPVGLGRNCANPSPTAASERPAVSAISARHFAFDRHDEDRGLSV